VVVVRWREAGYGRGGRTALPPLYVRIRPKRPQEISARVSTPSCSLGSISVFTWPGLARRRGRAKDDTSISSRGPRYDVMQTKKNTSTDTG